MSTINPPSTHAQVESDWGLAHVFAGQELVLELQDMMNAMDLGVVPLVGDLAGSRSDTLRVRAVGDIGFGVTFDAMASETDAPTAKAILSGYTEVTIASYGLSHEESYFSQALGSLQGVTIDELKAAVPTAWMATFRSLVATAGAGFATAIGSASTQLSVDDCLDLRAAARANQAIGSRLGGMLDPVQWNQLLESIRSEPAYQNAAFDFERVQGADTEIMRNVLGLNMDFGLTDDVTESGGAYQGFAHTPGGIGWARASTAEVVPSNMQGAIYAPEFGLVIHEVDNGNGQPIRKYVGFSFFGVAAASNTGVTTAFQRRLISTT